MEEAFWSDVSRAKYAAGGEIDVAKYPMPTSIQVDGAGDLGLPLSHHDLLKLKGVSAGEQTLGACQVEASKVSCPQIPDFFEKVAKDVASAGLTELGIDADALGLEVRLSTLLVYEEGGHCNLHLDEKEVGMFATMMLQVPTQLGYEDGQLEVCHGKNRESFDFSGAKSMTGYFKTVFFCDCKHKLAEIKSGSKVCLLFSLVRKNAKLVDVHADRLPNYISALGRVQRLLKEWVDTAKSPPLLYIPLGYKYSNKGLSFGGLKGYDRVVCALVLSCTGFLDVHLCMLVKEATFCEDSNESVSEFRVSDWTTLEDRRAKCWSSSKFDIEKENVLSEDLFNDEDDPDEMSSKEGKHCITTSVYRAAALVVWPKERRMEALCHTQTVRDAVEWFEEQHKHEPERTGGDLQRYLKALVDKSYNTVPSDPEEEAYDLLLMFCVSHDYRDAAFMVLNYWSMDILTKAKTPVCVILAIRKYGWDECYKAGIHEALESGVLSGCVLYFPKFLEENGLQDAAVLVAKELLQRDDIHENKIHYFTDFVEFLVGSGLEDEAWHALRSSTRAHSSKWTSALAQKWGDKNIVHIEEFLEERLGKLEYVAYVRGSPEERRKRIRVNECHTVVRLIVALDRKGCHAGALALTNKFLKVGDDVEAMCDEDITENALVLLLRGAMDKFQKMLTRLREWDIQKLVGYMKEAAVLTGLGKDDKVTQIFRQLLAGLVKDKTKNKKQIRRGVDIELLDTVFWLGDAELVTALVTKVESDLSLVDGLFGANEEDELKDEETDMPKMPHIDELLQKAQGWSDIGKEGWIKVVKARYPNFKKKRKLSEGEGESEDEEVDEDIQHACTTASKSPSIRRKRMKWETMEKERLFVEEKMKTLI